MITVIYSKKDNEIKTLSVSGHANYAEHGSDIVCSAVSMVCYTIANKIINLNNDFKIIIGKDTFEFTNNINDSKIDLLLETLLEGLFLVEDQYSDYITIKEERDD